PSLSSLVIFLFLSFYLLCPSLPCSTLFPYTTLFRSMLWAYMAFAQYLLIWSGNLPEENVWYVHRLAGGWRGVGLGLILFHFALPDRKSTRLNSSHEWISYAVFCLKKKKTNRIVRSTQ